MKNVINKQGTGFDLGMKVCCQPKCQKKASAAIKGLWHCPDHLQEERHRLTELRNRPRCKCGNMTRQDTDVCGTCEDKRDAETYARNAQYRELDQLLEMETIEDIRTYLVAKLMGEEF